MKYTVVIELTAMAKALLQDETALAQFDFADVLPNAGDTVAIRDWPGNAVVNLRCSRRHFDLSEAGSPRLCILLDMVPPGLAVP